MSLDATRWAWQQDIRPTHKLVLLSLADRAGEKHECHPSIQRIEKDTGLYRETIMEAISQMEKLGLIRVQRSNGSGNKYTLTGVESRHQTSMENQSGKADRYGKADQSGKADRTSREKPTATSREKPTQNLPIESTKNLKHKHTRFAAREYLLRKGVSERDAIDYLSIRKDKNLPPTQKAMLAIEAEAEKAGKTFCQAIAICCENAWAGFKASWLENARNTDPDYSQLRD